MIIAKHDTEHEDGVSFTSLERIERLILNSIADREQLRAEADMIDTQEQAEQMIVRLLQTQGIPGRDYTPHTVVEQGQAIRHSADLDDYNENRKR